MLRYPSECAKNGVQFKLSAVEITALYNSGAVKFTSSSVALQQGSTLASGLVGHWTFDGVDVTDTAISDRSGSGNNAYFVNAATASAKDIGKLGQAMRFDGTDDFVNPNSAFGQPSQITIAAWFKTSGTGGVIFGQANATPPASPSSFMPALAVNTAGLLRGELWTGSVASTTSVVPVNDGSWHHAVLVGSGTNQSLYLDGNLQGSRSGTITQTWWTASQIGTGYDGSAARLICPSWCYFNESIDDVRVYNRALAADEVKQLYNLGRAIIRQ